MKQIILTIPDDKFSESITTLIDKQKENSFVSKIHAGTNFIVMFRASDTNAIDIVKELLELNFPSFGQVDVLPVEVSKPELAVRTSALETDPTRKPVELIYKEVSSSVVNGTHAKVAAGTELTPDFVCYLIAASVIAGGGLAINSVVAVVAAMLVSPLMGPILAFSLAPLLRDSRLLLRGLRNEAIALLGCVFLGFLIGLGFMPFGETLEWPTEEMSGRGQVSSLLVGIIIALPSGAGVALGVSTGGVNSLVGVAISASLLPPAVNRYLHNSSYFSGMCIAYGLVGPLVNDSVDRGLFLRIGGISFALTAINIACVWVAGMIFFKIKEVAPFMRQADAVTRTAEPISDSSASALYHIVAV